MKQLFSLLMSFVFFTGICKAQDSLNRIPENPSYQRGQSNIPPVNTKDYYEYKRARLNTTAWVFLGLGVTLGTTGLIIYENAKYQDDLNNLGNTFGGSFLIGVGSAFVLTSIPIFIRSGYYKKKGLDMSASLKMEPYQSGVALKHYPSVGLSIRL